jgi:hypothetical protein
VSLQCQTLFGGWENCPLWQGSASSLPPSQHLLFPLHKKLNQLRVQQTVCFRSSTPMIAGYREFPRPSCSHFPLPDPSVDSYSLLSPPATEHSNFSFTTLFSSSSRGLPRFRPLACQSKGACYPFASSRLLLSTHGGPLCIRKTYSSAVCCPPTRRLSAAPLVSYPYPSRSFPLSRPIHHRAPLAPLSTRITFLGRC